jgi:hypothetical protein
MRKVEEGSRTYERRLAELANLYLNPVQCLNCGSPRSEGWVCPFCHIDDTSFEFTEKLKKKEEKKS